MTGTGYFYFDKFRCFNFSSPLTFCPARHALCQIVAPCSRIQSKQNWCVFCGTWTR